LLEGQGMKIIFLLICTLLVSVFTVYTQRCAAGEKAERSGETPQAEDARMRSNQMKR
jgi:hypothetical protein